VGETTVALFITISHDSPFSFAAANLSLLENSAAQKWGLLPPVAGYMNIQYTGREHPNTHRIPSCRPAFFAGADTKVAGSIAILSQRLQM